MCVARASTKLRGEPLDARPLVVEIERRATPATQRCAHHTTHETLDRLRDAHESRDSQQAARAVRTQRDYTIIVMVCFSKINSNMDMVKN
jgi:hypothetical protein